MGSPDGLPVWTHRHHLDGTAAPHEHEFLEVTLVTGGTATYVCSDEGRQVRPGSAVIVPPGHSHGYVQCSDLVLFDCFVAAAFVTETLAFLDQPLPLLHTVHHAGVRVRSTANAGAWRTRQHRGESRQRCPGHQGAVCRGRGRIARSVHRGDGMDRAGCGGRQGRSRGRYGEPIRDRGDVWRAVCTTGRPRDRLVVAVRCRGWPGHPYGDDRLGQAASI
ncbi:AraC family ligand binding domain-containing protein [Streptomyces sp. NPDC004752]